MTTNDQIILDQVVQQKHQELAPSFTSSQFFEVFVAEQILKDYDLSYDEIEAGIVGAGGDGGIDALYIFANGELVLEDFDFSTLKRNVALDIVILQAKLSNSFGETAIDKLIAVSEDLFNFSNELYKYATVYNEAILSGISTFRRVYSGLAARFPILRFTYVYATRGKEVHPNVQRKAETLREKIHNLFSSSQYTFNFLGAADLLQLARRAPITSYALSLAEIPISSTGDVGYVCLVKLRDFYTFISDDNGHLRKSLFEANVRDYQGATQVNDDIQFSLQNRSREDFWWLNNGVTIVASQATQSGKMLTLEDPQIVNGLQTSTEIYNYFRGYEAEGEDRTLLVRVIVPTAAESRDRIIKATNSQTYIPPASLRATDKIHRDIEEYLKSIGLFYDRRKNSYKNEGKPADLIVSISLMSQAVMAILLQRPDSARARPSSLLKSDADYERLFSDKYPIDTYRVCIVLLKRSEYFLREIPEIPPKDRNNLRFYLAMHVAACLCEKATPNTNDLCNIMNESLKDSVFKESLDLVANLYYHLGGTDQLAKSMELLDVIKSDLSLRYPPPIIQKATSTHKTFMS